MANFVLTGVSQIQEVLTRGERKAYLFPTRSEKLRRNNIDREKGEFLFVDKERKG